ncbi:MAG: hypothetical protein WCL06_08630 [Bacteroidota bacterium]
MQKWRYYTGLIVLWLLFSTATLLLLFRMVVSYGKVEVKVDYTAFKKENISIYWSEMLRWDTEKYQQQKTHTGRHTYHYTIRHAQSIFFLRIDPDETCDSAILHSVSINGITCPLEMNTFDSCRISGVKLVKVKDGTLMVRDKNDKDPHLVIKIPKDCRAVIFKWKTADIIFILLTLLADIALLFFCIRRRFLSSMMQKRGFYFVLVFLLFISLHWLNYALDFYPVQPNIEKRKLEKFPDLDSLLVKPDTIFMRYSQACYDHFRYRNLLIKSRSSLYLDLFGESSMPGKVVMGEKQMFFPSFAWLTDDFMGRISYSQGFIDSLVMVTKEKQEMLARQGIKFLVVVPPAKQTVYYDLMPAYYRLQQKKPSLLDQIEAAMKKAGINYFVSLADTMIGLKNSHPDKLLYYLNDTHWNEYGAFKAYQVFMKSFYDMDTLFGRPLNEKEISVEAGSDINGDLAECLIINDINKRSIYKIHPFCDDSIPCEIIPDKKHNSDSYRFYNPNGYGKILFYRDSYFVAWQPFFTHHFRESIYIWDYHMDMNEIMRYKPDYVVLEIGEMYVTNMAKAMKPLSYHGN